jgi:hypothetical protein
LIEEFQKEDQEESSDKDKAASASGWKHWQCMQSVIIYYQIVLNWAGSCLLSSFVEVLIIL